MNGLFRLEDIKINLMNGNSLVKLSSLELKAPKLEIFAKLFEFEAITLNGPELFVSRSGNGEWMYSYLLPQEKSGHESKTPAAKKPDSRKADHLPLLRVSSLTCSNGTVHFRDALPMRGFKTVLTKIDLALKDFNTEPGKSAKYELSLLLDSDVTFNANGAFSVTPLAATSSVALAGLKIERGWPYLSRYLTAPVKGKLDLSGNVTFSSANGLSVEQGNIALKGLSARTRIKEGLDIALLKFNGVAFQQRGNRLKIDDVRLSGGDVSFSREADGSISLLSLIANPEKRRVQSAATSSVATNKNRSAGASKIANPLVYRLKHFQLDRFNLAVTDKTREEEPRFTLHNASLTLANLNGPKFTPAALRFTSTFGKDAALKAAGDIIPVPFNYQGNLNVERLPIKEFEAYFPDSMNVNVIGGYLDTAMNVNIAFKEGKPTGSFQGSAGVRAFHSVDAVAEEDLLKWESLQFDEMQGNLEPFSLSIHDMALNNVYTRIVVRKDGTLNLQNLVDKEDAPKPAAPAPSTAVPESVKTAAVKPLIASALVPAYRRITVGVVTVQDGILSFTDNHLPQTFSTTFFKLGGRISGLSSEESKFADVDLRGNLENHSPLQISGRVNPLRDDLFVDLKVSFQDIELSPVTPYSGTYLGYTVDKGKLFLDLKYLIDKRQLNSENKVFIDQFTFGRKVESDKATNLPVRLAVALLKDRKGEIHLDLPVTGRTDDPKLSIWDLVGQVLKNLLVKTATSPFALLSSMMGSGQDFSAVHFSAGSSKLTAEEENKLQQLARALTDRPGIKIEIKGFVDKNKDLEGYRREVLSRKLHKEKFLELVKEQKAGKDESAETVQIAANEYSPLLKTVYKKEKFPKPRNAIGLVKELPDSEMEKLIIANTVVGESELQSLARQRSAAVMNYLASKGELPQERLFQKNDVDIYMAPAKDTMRHSRVEFNAIAH